jgi:hypothetical protein
VQIALNEISPTDSFVVSGGAKPQAIRPVSHQGANLIKTFSACF